jgi:hypothetical protein
MKKLFLVAGILLTSWVSMAQLRISPPPSEVPDPDDPTGGTIIIMGQVKSVEPAPGGYYVRCGAMLAVECYRINSSRTLEGDKKTTIEVLDTQKKKIFEFYPHSYTQRKLQDGSSILFVQEELE